MVNGNSQEIATLEDIEDAISEHVLLCVHRVEAQRAWNSALNEMKGAKGFDAVKQHTMEQVKTCPRWTIANTVAQGTPRQCPANGKKCGYRKQNHFKVV